MITFTSETNNRVFTVYDNNFHFIQKLLLHDLTVGNTIVQPNSWLGIESATVLALNISNFIKSNSIYEFQSGGLVEPLINPTEEQLKTLKHCIRPLSSKRKDFLVKFTDYLLENGSFNIESV